MPNNSLTQSLQMVDLKGQYQPIAGEINEAIQKVLNSTAFINGPEVKEFAGALANYTGAAHVIPCANGTDALQLAMMALNMQPGDEVIVPTFTYVATVEVIALLGLIPVFVDVNPQTFNIKVQALEPLINSRTKAIVPVHLFGQCADMDPIMELAKTYKLSVIEDTAQALGAEYNSAIGTGKKAGTIGTIGTTSFFPSKNLGCFGDGGAIFTNDDSLAVTLKAMANHGQFEKYYHEMIGVNSRLDTIQAAILNVKLKHLDSYAKSRSKAAAIYDQELKEVEGIQIPTRSKKSTHVFHQYTLQVKNNLREALRDFLKERGVPSMVYYPVPLHLQKAYKGYGYKKGDFPVAEMLSEEVLSLPMHTELEEETIKYITEQIKSFFNA